MFSHTAKGQQYNTPLLERFIKDLQADSNKKYRRLIDYELLTDGDGKRTIGFGYHAGGSRFLPKCSLTLMDSATPISSCRRSRISFGNGPLTPWEWHCITFPCMVLCFPTICYDANVYSIFISTHPDLTLFLQRRAYGLLFDPLALRLAMTELRESWALS